MKNRKISCPTGLTGILYGSLILTLLVLSLGCAGSATDYTDRMAKEHEGDTPVPTEAVRAPQALKIKTSQPVYATVDGREVTGYLAEPLEGAADAPGLLVIHEWWGLNDNIETMARLFAQQGYRALAVDLYDGQVAEDGEGARALMQGAMEAPEQARENLRQGHNYLTQQLGAGSTGSIGWCFGGAWSLQSALLLPGELDAAVIYYGRLVTDPADLAPLTTPILGIFGAEDQGIPVDQVEAFRAALGDLGKEAEVHIYEGANHAFANPSGTRYAPEAAKDAWDKTLAFFAEHLQSGEGEASGEG